MRKIRGKQIRLETDLRERAHPTWHSGHVLVYQIIHGITVGHVTSFDNDLSLKDSELINQLLPATVTILETETRC